MQSESTLSDENPQHFASSICSHNNNSQEESELIKNVHMCADNMTQECIPSLQLRAIKNYVYLLACYTAGGRYWRTLRALLVTICTKITLLYFIVV